MLIIFRMTMHRSKIVHVWTVKDLTSSNPLNGSIEIFQLVEIRFDNLSLYFHRNFTFLNTKAYGHFRIPGIFHPKMTSFFDELFDYFNLGFREII